MKKNKKISKKKKREKYHTRFRNVKRVEKLKVLNISWEIIMWNGCNAKQSEAIKR